MLKALTLKTIVIKIGTKVLTTKGYHLDRRHIGRLVNQISVITQKGVRVVVVSSGAICSGMGLLGFKTRPTSLSKLQACAAVGQPHLMQVYDNLFNLHHIRTAQVLLTQEDINDRGRYLNAKATLQTLLNEGVVPIVNENDTVSTEEIRFGDNDKLSSLVANLIGADILILLSSVDGLYRYERLNKMLIAVVDKITEEIKALAQKGTDELGTGGMLSKLEAAKIATDSGIPCIIANGKREEVLINIVGQRQEGTLFLPSAEKLTARKGWLGFSARVKGEIKVDDGAKEALLKNDGSLLASGVTEAVGEFRKNDIVRIVDINGREFARGIANYSSDETEKIKGLKTNQITKALGYKREDEVVHKDNLVIL